MNELVEQYGSAAEVARLSGISEGAVRKYRDGLSEPNVSRLIELSKGLKVNLLWLATGEGEKQEQGADQTTQIATYRLHDAIEDHPEPSRTLIQRMRTSRATVQDAAEAVGYIPPEDVTEALSTCLLTHQLPEECLLTLLQALARVARNSRLG